VCQAIATPSTNAVRLLPARLCMPLAISGML
jgi:hypothetical protein